MRPLVATVAGLIIVACSGQATPSTTEAATNTTTVATTAATTVTTETTATPSTTALVSLDFPDFAVPFTLGEQPDWSVAHQIEDWAIGLTTLPTRLLLVTSEGPGPSTAPSEASVELWVEHFNSSEFVEAVEVGEGVVGGLPARVFDLRFLPGDDPGRASACSRPCLTLLNRSITPEGAEGFAWFLVEGLPNRAWLVDVDGATVVILAEALADDFEAWVAEVESALAELVWTG